MGEPRISVILIGVLLMALVVAGFTSFIGSGATKYGVTGYNETLLNDFSSVAYEVENISTQTSGNLSNVASPDLNNPDIFGGFFARSWSAIKTIGKSTGVFFKVIDKGLGELPITNNYSKMLRTVLMSMVIIIIFIAILFHYIRPSSRL